MDRPPRGASPHPLPAGLFFDPATGRISGTPTSLSSATSYSVTASNTGGSGTPLTITISVVDIAPVISYQPVYTFTIGSPISAIAPGNTGGAASTWSIGPALPPGLVFDPATGRITGTPTGTPSSSVYSVQATNSGGVSQPAGFTLNLIAPVTASISASPTSPLFGASVTLTPVFTNAVNATVGTGRGSSDLSLSATNGAGIATSAITSPRTYWLRATNAAGDLLDASVLVSPQTVVVNPIAPSSPTRTVGSSTTFSTTATGGVTNGLLWSADGGAIDPASGVWNAPATTGTVTVTATSRDDATKSSTITVNVVAAGTSSITASTTTPLFGATVTLTPTFTNAVSAGVGTVKGASDLSASPTTGSAILTAAITATKTFWLRTTNAAGDSLDVSVTITPQTIVVGPIAPAAPVRTVSTPTTFTAIATGGVTDTLTWSASSGTIDPATGAWTAPSLAGSVVIKATSSEDPARSSTTTATVVVAGTSLIVASNNSPLYGATVTLTPTFSNAASATIGTGKGGSDISTSPVNGVPIPTAALTTPKTYWLRVIDPAGNSIDSSVNVTPQTVAVSAITPAAPTRSVGAPTTFTALATGGLTNSLTWTASAGTITAAGVWTAPSTPQTVVITATAKDDTSKYATTAVNVVANTTASITASTGSPLYGATVILTPTFANAVTATVGTAKGVSDVSSTATTGVGLPSSALTSPTTFWLRATNAAGDFIDPSVTVTPQTVAIAPITASSLTVSVHSTSNVKTTVTNAVDTSINWTATGGALSSTNTQSSVLTTWTAPSVPGAYVLTAASAANGAKTATITMAVVSLPLAASLTPSTTTPLYGAAINLTPTFSAGTGSVDNSVGAVTSGTSAASLALTLPTTFTLTVTNTAGQTATAASPLITPQTVSVDVPVGANQKSTLTTGYTQAYTAAVHGALTTTVTWTATGGSWTGSTWHAPSAPGPYMLTATSVADPSKSNSTLVTVVIPPVIASFIAADPLISLNHATNLTAVYTNGAGIAVIGTTGAGSSNLTAAAGNNLPIPTGNLAATSVFTLTVYNEAGNSTSATTTVTVVAGSSSPTAPLSGPRYAQTDTLLPDGRVLIAGGRGDAASLNTSQIFDPTVGSFSDAGTMITARYGHTATLLANNTVLLAGGDNGSTTAAAELWNGAFAATAALNTAREKHTATLLLNGKVLIVGGLDGSSPIVTAELYDPSTGACTYTLGNLNTARYSHTATLLANGKVLLSGGSNGSVALQSAELYDPSTGVFTVVGSMAAARQRHAAVLLNDGTVAMIGGQGTTAPLASAEIFNSSTNTFTTTSGSLANARDSLTATLIASGKVVVSGGLNGSGTPVQDSEIFDPSTGCFGLSGLLSAGRAQHAATLLQNGRILLVGGLTQTGSTPGATAGSELFDPQDGLVPVLPNATVTAPTGASRAQTGLTASVPAQTHVQYVWMITGGAITAGSGTNSVTFSMPATGTATLDLLVISDRLVPSHAQFVVTPKPVITAFSPTKSTLTVGNSTTLNWTVQEATGLSIDQAVGTVTGATSTLVTTASLGVTTYVLTATNAGGSATATTSILAVPAPLAASLTAAASTVPVGANTTLTPIFSQGTGSVDGGIGAVLSGPAYPTAVISAPTTFTLTVTNAAGDIAQKTVTVGLQPVAVTGVIGPQYISAGHTAAYTAAVTGAVNTAVTWNSDAGSVDASGHLTAPAGAPYNTTPTPLTVTAASVKGGTPGSLTVQVVPMPSITSFTSYPATAAYGGSTSITPTFVNGTGQIVGLGSVTSGQPVSSGPLTASKTFTLLVTNLAGDSATQTLPVNQTLISVSTPATASGPIVTTGDVLHYTSSTTGAADTSVSWTADGGTFSGSNWTAPATGAYTITANSVAPTGYSASATITVIDAPTIASFTSAASTISANTSTTLQAAFAGGAATVRPGAITPVTGTPFSTGNLATTTSYTLSVSNSATVPKTVTRSLTVNVIAGVVSTLPMRMAFSRVSHTVTLLTNGDVLIAGGSSSKNAETFNASAQTLSLVNSPMQAIRYSHTATLMADGRVLLAGGSAGAAAQNTAEIFDPSTGTFTATSGLMTQARRNHSAALMPDGRVLLSGGVDASGIALTSSEIYDPLTDTFAAAPVISSARQFSTATSLQNGSTLLAGGDDATSSTNIAQTFDGSVYNSFTLAQARSEHTATLLSGGGVFLAGGISQGAALSSTEAFTGSAFAPKANLVTARFGQVANLLASGQVFLTGGTGDGSTSLTSSEIFDPAQNQLWNTASLGTARFEAGSTILRSGNVLVVGGATTVSNPLASALNSAELFNPQDSLVPVLPNATITAPSYASVGATGLAASVPAQSNVNFVWSITNGAVTSGLNTRSITFTKGPGGASVLNVLVISDRQVPVHSSATVTAAPSITSFTATPSTNTTGLSSTFAWTASGAAGLTLSIDNGVGDVTALGGSTAITTPASSIVYTLTATDANGTTSKSLTLGAVPMPVASGLTAAVNPIEKGSSTTILPTFATNGSASINNNVGAVISGVAYPTGNLSGSTTFTLTVLNSVGTPALKTLTVNVMPVVVGPISGPANVSLSSSSAQFSAAVTGAVDKSVTWSVSAGSITSGGLLTVPATAEDILVTATSAADPAQHSQVTVHVVGLPLATGITAATNPVLYGGSTTVTPQFSQGAGVIDQGIGSVNPGIAYTTGTITVDKTFILTVTNSSGATATFPYTVHPQTVVVSAITGPASGKVTQGRNANFTATVTGAFDTSVAWSSAGAGAWSGNTWTAPATTGVYTITATAVNGATNTLSITVVVAPAISGFSAAPVGINKNQSSTLTASFTGAGTGSNAGGIVTPGNLALPSGGAGISTGALSASLTYTLTVTNDAGDTATTQTTVQVFLGSFSATSNGLTPARNLPTATLRPDGNVLVAGGGNASSAADIFNGAALSFSQNSATLLAARTGQTSTLLPNGLILLAGGSNGAATLATAELYNPADGSFTATGALKQPRRNHRAVLLDTGKVLLVGGTSLNTAELYDPATGAFTLISSMSTTRDSATASRLPDGRILIAGGLNGSTRLSTAEIFDPSTNTFSTAANMLQPHALHTATTLPGGEILIAGGTGGAGHGSAELFNTSLLKFVTTGDMIQPRQEHIARLLAGGMVLLAGGNSGVSPNAIDQAELFDPFQGSFLKTDFMSTTGSPATAAAATLLPFGKVLVTGGTSNGSTVVPGSALYTPTDGLSAAAADATLTVPTFVPQAATAVAAHVTALANARYIWLVTNATLVSGQGSPSITLNMPASGNATLDVLIVTDRLVPSHGRSVIVGDPAPVISSFSAATNPVLYGASTSITPVFANALGDSVIGTGAAGASDITASAVSGVAIPIGPLTSPIQYRLTVTNRAGVSVNRTLVVAVQTVIVSAISPANPTLSVSDGRGFSASVSQAVNNGLVWSATGGSMNPATGAWTAPSTPGTYTIKATSAADNTTSAVTTATVVAFPTIQSFAASPTSVNFGQPASLMPVFTGAAAGMASIGIGGAGSPQLTSTATSGSAILTNPLTANTTYTLTVTSAAGASVTATTQVAVVQPFSATGSLALPRLGQTTTLLPDGSVLIAGGTAAADKAEIYTAGSGVFSDTQPMHAARKGHTATLLPTGQVLLVGGFDGTAALSSAELFDPTTRTFTTTAAAMTHARQNHAAALLLDGRVLIVGGSNSTENQLNSAEIFDPATGSFSAVPTTLTSAREFATATTLNDGRILVAGGFNGMAHLATAELFSNGAFTTPVLPMGAARSHHTANLLPTGKVLLSGGYDGSNRLSTSTLFNPGTPDSFSVAGTMSQTRQDATATLLTGGKVLIAGGTDGTSPRSSADLFNPADSSFAATGNLLTARSAAGSALLSDGTVLVAGGTTDGASPLASAERFNPQDSLAPFQPDATVVPSSTHATLGATGLTAAAPAHTGNRYVWFIRNGAITSGQGTSTVTFSMPNSGDAVLDLLAISDRLVPAHSQVTIASDPLPQLASFTASLNPLPYGGSTTLTAVFSNATSARLGTAGYGSSDLSASVVSGTPITLGPLTSFASLTLTLPEVVGNKLSSTLIVNVQPVLVSAVSPALPSVTAGHTQTFSAAVTQALNAGIAWSSTGGAIDPATGVWTAPSTPGAYTIKATASADNITFTTTTATVVALPSIASFTASPASINYGQSASLTPVFTAPAGSLASIGTTGPGSSDVSASVTSGTAVSTSALTSTLTVTLTVTNAVGDSATKTAVVTVTQPFSPTGSLALARTGQTTTQLSDGSVLVAGGTGAADKAEIYVPASGVFAPTSIPMASARKNHTATLLADGRVLLTGGSDARSALSTAELFEPATGAFTLTTGSMVHARQNHAATLLPDGRVLLIGGSNPTENQLASAEIFDPATGSFTALGSSLAEAREFAAATALPNGDVLVTGGAGLGAAPLASAELYSGGVFGPHSFPMRSARLHHTATLLASGQVLLTGGFDGFNRVQTAELYSGGSTASSFTPTTGSLATGRDQHQATPLASGKVLLTGGFDGTVPLAAAELFDPSTQAFSPAGNLSAARFGAGAALLQTGKVLIVGGSGASATPLSAAELFDPRDGQTPDLSGVQLSGPSAAPFGTAQTASVTLPTGAFCIWSVDNGTLISGAGTRILNFTTGLTGNTVVRVLVYTQLGLPILANQVVVGH